MHIVKVFDGTIFISKQADRIQFSPGPTLIGAFQKRSLLDASVDGFRVFGIEGDEFGMRDMRRRRKCPLGNRRHGTDGRNFIRMKP